MPGSFAMICGRAADVAADLLWPPRCGGCDLPGAMLCDRCRSELPVIEAASACPRCGAPDGARGCAECGRSELSFALGRCAGVFEWPLDRMVRLHKDSAERRLAEPLARLAISAAGEWADWAQAVVPVPASPGVIARRGFDHGALLAAVFAHLSRVPALEALEARPRRDQRGLDRERRARNARASIVPVPGVTLPPRVLVIDDVFTTGATLDAATRALVSAGGREVRVVAVARACGGRL